MNPTEAAEAAGWWWNMILRGWHSTDLDAIAAGYHPWMWSGTARDLCLAHGIEFK